MENLTGIDELLNSATNGLSVQKSETNLEAVAEMLDKYGLRWNVLKQSLFLPDGTDTGFFGIVREDTKKVFTTTKDSYTIFQNSELAELLLRICNKTGYKIKSGGMFNEGGKVYIQLDTDTKIVGIGKANATIHGYVTGLNSHDGTNSLKFGDTSINIICMNTFNAAKKELKNKLRHTISIHDKIDEYIREINGVIEGEKTIFEKLIKLSEIPVTKESIARVVKAVTKVDITKNEDISTYARNRATELTNSISLELNRQGQTMFGLFNGVTHYTSHVMPTPSRNNARMESKYLGSGYMADNIAFNEILTYLN